MDVNKLKKYSKSGQAIFEMLVFFPFIILLFTLIVTIGNSINGSINQQKATRAYFYYSIAGDSMGAPHDDMVRLAGQGVTSSGLYAFGWREKEESGGSTPFATCYRMNQFLGNNKNESCEEPDVGEGSSGFIRVFTAYGICTGSINQIAQGNYTVFNDRTGLKSCSVE